MVRRQSGHSFCRDRCKINASINAPMKTSECIIEQHRGGRLVRSFHPSGDDARPWRMHVGGKSYLRSHGWVLSKILPTLVDGSPVTTRVVALGERDADGRVERGDLS